MNEQQLADLFSDQLDHLLQGQTPVLPPEAGDLQELMNFGQQFSQITFQPSPAAQGAFQGQLTSWFGSIPGGPATILGLPKTLFLTLIAAAIVAGIGLTLTVFPASDPQDVPMLPAFNTDAQDSSEPEASATPAVTPSPPQSSLGETIPSGGSSSLEDTLPSSPSSFGETLPIPTPTATAGGCLSHGC